MALGFGIGIRKMARISNQINESELEHTVNWYFSVENTHAANDQVLRLVDRLELPNLYRRSPDRLHTSSDGQKFEVHLDSLNANYSFKYFGKGQGVTVYSFRDERDLLWHSTVFSSGERESAYVIDGLMHNDVVKSDIHSTDSAGFSEAIFGIAYLLGFSYAPRFKNLKRQKRYIFKSHRNIDRSIWKIKPNGYIDTDLIEQNWDDILRLIATLKLKEVTASDLFRRLNSYSQQHAVYRASKAFGKIIKSLFILRITDDIELRQATNGSLPKSNTRTASRGRYRWVIRASLSRPRNKSKRSPKAASGCSRTVLSAGIISTYPRSWRTPAILRHGKRSYKPWLAARW